MFKMLACLFLLLLLAVACHSAKPDGDETDGNQGGHESREIPDAAEGSEPDNVPPAAFYNDYHVTLEIDPEARTVEGMARVVFTNRTGRSLSEIVMRTYLNAFSEGFRPPPYFPEHEQRVFRGGDVSHGHIRILYVSIDNADLEYEHNGTVLALFLPEKLEPLGTVQITVQFQAVVPQIAHLTGSNDKAMWFGMFLPMMAVYGDGGWHREEMFAAGSPFILETASFHVEVTAPIAYTVVGTGLRSEETFEDTGIKITTFTAQQVRDFAFAVSRYFSHSRISTESGIDIHFYSFTDTISTDGVLAAAKESMERLEFLIGMFPFQHITIVEADISLDQASLSQVIFMDSIPLRNQSFRGLSHAIGNQWLANIVGSNRIAYPWLTEGLTRFVMARALGASDEYVLDFVRETHESIAEQTNLRLNLRLHEFESWRHYALTHGRKGMSMAFSLYNTMGQDAFWQLMNDYFHAFSFGMATGGDFMRLAESAHGESLEAFFDKWFRDGSVPQLYIGGE